MDHFDNHQGLASSLMERVLAVHNVDKAARDMSGPVAEGDSNKINCKGPLLSKSVDRSSDTTNKIEPVPANPSVVTKVGTDLIVENGMAKMTG